MAVNEVGTSLITGAGTITGSYFVESRTDSEFEVDFEDINDQDGELATRIIKKRHEKVSLELICKLAAAPATDFPEGSMCLHTDFTTYYVEAAPIQKSASAQRVSVSLINLGVTA